MSKHKISILRFITILLLTAICIFASGCNNDNNRDSGKDSYSTDKSHQIYDNPEDLANVYLKAKLEDFDAKTISELYHPGFVEHKKKHDGKTYKDGEKNFEEDIAELDAKYSDWYYTYEYTGLSEIQDYYVEDIEDFYNEVCNATVEDIKFLRYKYTLHHGQYSEEAYTNEYGVYAVKIDGYWYLTSDYIF